MAPGKRIFLHIGAHRTGTSSVQMCLHLNRAALRGAGFDLAYPGRDDIPSGDLALSLPSPRHGRGAQGRFAARVARKLARHSPDAGRALLLSEENIPGRMIHFFSGRFYPAAEARLEALRTGFGDARAAGVLLVLRPYDGLIRSAYRKRAEDRAVEPFAEVAQQVMAMDRGWPALVRAVRSVLRPEALHVVDFAARGTSARLVQTLVPEFANLPLAEPSARVNRSATDAALEALQARYAAGEVLERAAWQAIVAQHAGAREDRGFARFTEAQIAALRARYAADLDAIAALEDVRLIR